MDFSRPWARFALLVSVLCLSYLSYPMPGSAEDILGGKLEKKDTRSDAEIKASISRLEKQAAADPKNYRLMFDLANEYVKGHNEDKAKAMYEKAIIANPKYVQAMVNLGSLYSDLEEHDEAIKWYEKALSVDPENCKARSNLGNVYYAMQRYPDAMFEYRRAVQQDPKCESAMYNIAVAFADAGLFREAVSWWKKVEKVAPGTEAARSARENIDILDRFTQPPQQAKSKTPSGSSKASSKPK
ncbi:MAG TPA: tetratricopeptide repeat protein [Candidatus Eisenbacteria bacterium]|nr:tetratricopeptide repeat protein [Candidatus Eisenbacteria bacterium]